MMVFADQHTLSGPKEQFPCSVILGLGCLTQPHGGIEAIKSKKAFKGKFKLDHDQQLNRKVCLYR